MTGPPAVLDCVEDLLVAGGHPAYLRWIYDETREPGLGAGQSVSGGATPQRSKAEIHRWND